MFRLLESKPQNQASKELYKTPERIRNSPQISDKLQKSLNLSGGNTQAQLLSKCQKILKKPSIEEDIIPLTLSPTKQEPTSEQRIAQLLQVRRRTHKESTRTLRTSERGVDRGAVRQ